MSTPNTPDSDAAASLDRYLADYNPPPASLADVVETEVRLVSHTVREKGCASVVESVMPGVLAVAASGGIEKKPRGGALRDEVRELVRRCLDAIADEAGGVDEDERLLPGTGRVVRVIAPHCCLVRANLDGRGEIRVCVPKELSGGKFPEAGAQVRVRARLDVVTQRTEPTAEIIHS